jgi:PAS domain S-box-containing protein
MSITRLSDGSFVDLNASYEQLFGYRRDELLGQSADALQMYTSPTQRAELVRRLREQGAIHNQDLTLRTKSGALREMLCSLEALEIDGETCTLAIVFDITERVQAEMALHASEERFRNAFMANPAPKLITRADSRAIIDANPAFAQMSGYTRAELIGQTTDALGLWPESPLLSEARAQRRQVELLTNQEVPTRIRDGSVRDLLLSTVPITLDGQACFLTVMLDQTDRKRAEAALVQQTNDLTRSNAELEQFAYVASHDLQEPLRAVAGMVQLLQQRYQGQLDARADQYIAHAVEGVTRMQTQIHDLLVFSRVGTRTRPFAPTAMVDALRAALANLAVALHESGATVTATELPTVSGDATQLTQLLQNLIGNAIKFHGDQPPTIQVSAERVGNTWRIALRDNGIGIAQEYFERIFVVFQRLHTRRAYAGTGIGLALCKKIVERHGGRIWVESTPGEGSTFLFTLPDGSDADAD